MIKNSLNIHFIKNISATEQKGYKTKFKAHISFIEPKENYILLDIPTLRNQGKTFSIFKPSNLHKRSR